MTDYFSRHAKIFGEKFSSQTPGLAILLSMPLNHHKIGNYSPRCAINMSDFLKIRKIFGPPRKLNLKLVKHLDLGSV